MVARLERLRTAVGSTLADKDLRALSDAADEWHASAGEVLLDEGHIARQGFVLLTGAATVRVKGEVVARLGPGSGVWPSTSPGATTPMTVTADSAMWLLVLNPSDLDRLRRADA
jgi:hypothetical protein